MIDDAIKSLRRYFLISLSILTVWFYSGPSTINKFTFYQDMLDIHAWLFLKEGLEALRPDVFHFKIDESIEKMPVEVYNEVGDYAYDYEPIEVEILWPRATKIIITFSPEYHFMSMTQISRENPDMRNRIRIYSIQSEETALPISDYDVVFFDSGELVVTHNDALETMKRLDIYRSFNPIRSSILRYYNHPRSCERFNIHLRKHGFKESLNNLTSTNKELKKLQEESDLYSSSNRISIFGIDLNIGLYFTTVGLFLTVIAFSMLGPILALRNSKIRDTSLTWFMIIPIKKTFFRLSLEVILSSLSLAWAISPIFVFFMQNRAHINSNIIGGWPIWIGGLGLAFTSIIFFWAAWELYLCRRISQKVST